MKNIWAKNSKMRRAYKIFSTGISIAAVAYLLLLTFPQFLFAHSMLPLDSI